MVVCACFQVNCVLRVNPRRNVKFCKMHHPRFGACNCVRSLRPIQRGEEIFADYGYNISVSDVPRYFLYKKVVYLLDGLS